MKILSFKSPETDFFKPRAFTFKMISKYPSPNKSHCHYPKGKEGGWACTIVAFFNCITTD